MEFSQRQIILEMLYPNYNEYFDFVEKELNEESKITVVMLKNVISQLRSIQFKTCTDFCVNNQVKLLIHMTFPMFLRYIELYD